MKCQAEKIALISMCCLCLIPIYFFQRQLRPIPEARREMRDFMSRIQLDDTRTQVQQKFTVDSYKILSLRADSGSDLWSVDTPFEIGSGNWILWLEFERDKLRALRLRIADGMPHRPRDAAPPDRIAPGWPREFPRDK